ncbi:MAG: oligosaccharide flippase family protein [Clostridia bacterium]|nr:oligosaccharide flippase family protein [Clostridia bacterium]
MKNHGNVYQTTALVTFFSVAERALGFLYRIVLARLLGAEGLGVYQIALSHFAFFRTVGGGGLPVATARLIAKKGDDKYNGAGKILAAACFLSLCITLPLTVIPSFISTVSSTLKILLIGLSFTCVYAVVKAFFWGNNQFLFPALLEIGEEIVSVVAGVLLLRFFGVNCTAVSGANLAAVACVIACVVSCLVSLFLLLTFPKKARKLSLSKDTLKEVGGAALPVTAMRAGSTLISSAVALIFPAMLIKAGMSSAEATAAFGVVTGMALPLLAMPMTLVGSFSLVLMPKLTEDYYQQRHERLYQNVERGLSCAVFVACLLFPFFFALGENIGLLTYENALAGEMLKNCCLLLLPMSVCMIINTVLNSMGFERKTLLFYLIGAAAMMLCIFFLPSLLGVYAYAVGLLTQYLVSGTLGAVTLFKRRKPSRFFLRKVALAIAFTLPVLFLGQGCMQLFARFFGVLPSMALTAVCMLVANGALYLVFGLFSTSSLRKILPKR